uniref:Uncharacterized protein n=1 Tax=Coccidioides posadasii RMSCC 3488 TaxID=454284 RepID=A0A0J6HXM4_COCPO|nr:hypothetical protein CPAG_00056 [Coccidioides posadasii RMSCC 3488]
MAGALLVGRWTLVENQMGECEAIGEFQLREVWKSAAQVSPLGYLCKYCMYTFRLLARFERCALCMMTRQKHKLDGVSLAKLWALWPRELLLMQLNISLSHFCRIHKSVDRNTN